MDLISDLPGEEVFKTMLFRQFKNPQERYEELTAQLKCMVSSVRQDIARSDYPLNSYSMLTSQQVAEIFYWCKILKVNTETFFRTMELFDRFYVLFNKEMLELSKSMDSMALAECKKRIVHQKSLRICSCIMLASKMHSNLDSASLTLANVKTALSTDRNKKSYSLKAVAESEIRVLRVLKYRAHWISPLDLTEQLISLLDLSARKLQHFYAVSLLYLKYSYMRHADIYAKLEVICRKQWWPFAQPMTREQFKRLIEYNSPLRAASVVTAAGFHVNDDHFYKATSLKLADLISEPDHKLITVSRLLIDLVRETHPRKILKI